MTSQPLHSWHQTSYIWHHIHVVWHIITYTYDITPTLSVSSHPMYLFYQIQFTYNIRATICMTSYPLYMTSHKLFVTSHHLIYYIKLNISDITSTISDLTSTVSMSSHPPYRWYHSHYIYDIRSSISVTSYPLYLWHNTHDVWHHSPVCLWHHTRHMYDIICTTEDGTSTLSHKTTVFMMSHALQAWHHAHSIRHCTHCIFVITTSPLIPHLLLYDITPTLCLTSYALYITSHPLLMSSHYCTYNSTTSIYETTSSMQGNLYTILVTSQPLICVITSTVLTTSHPVFVWHHSRHMYGIFTTIQDITSSLYGIKQPFIWHHTHYMWHHIHYIHNITATVSVPHTHSFHEFTPFVCLTSHPSLYNIIYTI